MAVVHRGAFVRKRVFGFGDAASDAWLSSSTGAASLAAAQAAAAKLPPGFTMGDPTSNMWGAAYYNGKKIIGGPGSSFTGSGAQVYDLEDSTEAPWTQATGDAIQAAANAAYGVYNAINGIRTASPEMFAILTDPEWIALEGSGQPIDFNSLSAELQTKIKAVPNLYNSLIGNLSALTPAPPPPAPTGPARYLVGGIEFLDTGTVLSVNGTTVSGQTLTQDQMHALLTTGALPAADTSATATATKAPITSDTYSYVPGYEPPPTPVATQTMDDTNPQQAITGGGITLPTAHATDTGGGGAVPLSASVFGNIPPVALAAAAVVGFLLLSKKRGR